MPPQRARHRVCRWPWERTFISREGFVVPCCQVSDPELVNFGNLFTQDFRDIWRGAPYQALRRALATSHPPKYCRNACHLDGEKES